MKKFLSSLLFGLAAISGEVSADVPPSVLIDTPNELLVNWWTWAIPLETAHRWGFMSGDGNFYEGTSVNWQSANWRVTADVYVHSQLYGEPYMWENSSGGIERDAFGALNAQHLLAGGAPASASYTEYVDGIYDGENDANGNLVNTKRVVLTHGSSRDVFDFSRIRSVEYTPEGGFSPTYTFSVHAFHGDVPAVPEPETYVMLLAGIGVVSLAVRRRQGCAAS
jgi:hypothetical protein